MAASGEQGRRRRYTRRPAGPVAPTPQRLALLRYLAQLGIASLPQLAALACPSEKSARRSLRTLFDGGLVEVVPVPRVALAESIDASDVSLLYGSAPNLFVLTRAGAALVEELGWEGEVRRKPGYGPRNTLFLAHELAVRDVFVFFIRCSRRYAGHRLEQWLDGPEGHIRLKVGEGPAAVRPDARLLYRLPEKVLVGLVEVDRGTERGLTRWKEKLAGYDALIRSGSLPAVTGYRGPRVLVVAPDARRRDGLAALIRAHAAPDIASCFWIAERSVLQEPELTGAHWRQPNQAALLPLVPIEIAGSPPTGWKGETDER